MTAIPENELRDLMLESALHMALRVIEAARTNGLEGGSAKDTVHIDGTQWHLRVAYRTLDETVRIIGTTVEQDDDDERSEQSYGIRMFFYGSEAPSSRKEERFDHTIPADWVLAVGAAKGLVEVAS